MLETITMIVKKPKMLIGTLLIVILITAAGGCTFLGVKLSADPAAPSEPSAAPDGDMFSLYIPGSECTIYLSKYQLDFPFGCDLQEISRRSFRAESFGQATVVESDGLQVTYLNSSEGVYTVTTIRAVKKGCSAAGAAIGDTEKDLLEQWRDKTLRKLDSISYDDEAWFGKYDLAYSYTPEESTKSVVYLIKDGLVSGIELINGLDGPMYY